MYLASSLNDEYQLNACTLRTLLPNGMLPDLYAFELCDETLPQSSLSVLCEVWFCGSCRGTSYQTIHAESHGGEQHVGKCLGETRLHAWFFHRDLTWDSGKSRGKSSLARGIASSNEHICDTNASSFK